MYYTTREDVRRYVGDAYGDMVTISIADAKKIIDDRTDMMWEILPHPGPFSETAMGAAWDATED